MPLPTETRVWTLANKPTENVILSKDSNATFKLETKPLPELKDGQLLLKTMYLSNYPAQRGWIDANISADRLYVPPVQVGNPMRARGVCKILSTKGKTGSFKEGDLVVAGSNWSEYVVVNASEAQPVKEGISPTHFLGALGLTGLTAYVGLIKIAEAKKGETIVISGAAGATGSMVVQIAKHIVGCSKVIGIAGSDEKCKWVESLGADECINYKNSDWRDKLIKATDGFVDIFFDNVGGEQLDLMLTRLKTYGRVSACGSIATYNDPAAPGLKNWFQVIMQRLSIKGFIVMDHLGDGNGAKMVGELVEAEKSGKIKIDEDSETVVDTKFEDIPKTWTILFEGGNKGKLVTKIV